MSDAAGEALNASSFSSAEEPAYDVIVCGTDLIQSILSSALSRAGKKVLHCDGNEWYGGFDAVLHVGSTLDAFIAGCGQVAVAPMQGKGGTGKNMDGCEEELDSLLLLPRERYGHLRIHSQSFIRPRDSEFSTTKEFMDSNTLDSKLQNLHIDDKNEKNEENDDLRTHAAVENESASTQQPTVNPLGHGFCFDLNPSLLFASGDAVDDLVKSGVADYLEFKSLKGLYLLMEEEKSSKMRDGRRRHTSKGVVKSLDNSNNAGDCGNAENVKLASYRVPCSKGDVFRSRLLSPVDKRRLMKFLQLISDYGVVAQFGDRSSDNTPNETESSEANVSAAGNADDAKAEPDALSGEDTIVQSINEHYLHRGRALSRPQNKATPSSFDLDSLMRCVREDVSFSDFLTKVAKLPERLCAVVVYALALAPFGHLERDRAGRMGDAISGISQYSTKSGVDDLVRHVTALGRFGDTAFLVTMYGNGELSQAFCRSGAVYGSTYMLRRSPSAISLDENGHVQGVVLSGEEHIGGSGDADTDDVSNRKLFCQHVIVPSTMMCPPKGSKELQTRIYRRVSILQGKLIVDQEKKDKDGLDTEQRYAIIIPPRTHGLGNESVIHGVAVDDSAFVAPRGENYTVLHLTTSSQGDNGTPDELFLDAMNKAVQFLVNSQPTQEDTEPIEEIHHISFSYSTQTPSPNEGDEMNSDETPGLHICYRDNQSLTCDSAFREAKRIFSRICPESDFLVLAKKVEDAIVYRDEQDSDDEKMVLESACTMIQAGTTEKPLSEANEETDESKV
mmetsp:Transcript_19478/g.41678  ORF Transcript_19478/g.41678 Transcript_19478/m.41678 type:complete len:787 (-) Transcript_19478:33-2393(-)|eukprot:CAMPEP_0172526316 /NCGR_PEP_ID=MMETSP1067-20121228/1259_1 /TAXON_ID=265564 ORGANISM="Thalassiosira punctigera, Strain Tpunct2005C2" /NCGR_SAMPLE_ID=MMETSP1067 /ASSEMBLY_ACC=CAM_ASM_000444 /LENGTH=786 /DNA_ID=CAMNT_0013309799 /DNA_START=50 /DNA_END=2410 /DNA_ORIENTATION=-